MMNDENDAAVKISGRVFNSRPKVIADEKVSRCGILSPKVDVVMLTRVTLTRDRTYASVAHSFINELN